MKTYNLSREQFLPISIEEAWAFFSNPMNLSVITPPEMKFVILTKLTDKPIFTGMDIDYTVSPLLNIAMHWTTEITGVDAPHVFTDRQKKGPYSLWEHTHTFKAVQGGVHMTDNVKYAIPLGFLGDIAHVMVIKNKLKHIFDFRAVKLKELFKAENK